MSPQKKRWNKCQEIGDKLNVKKAIINVGWNRLEPLFDGILKDDPISIDTAKKLIESIESELRVVHPDDGDEPVVQTKAVNSKDLGLAFWFINKIGSPARAKKLINAAVAATEALNAPEEASDSDGVA